MPFERISSKNISFYWAEILQKGGPGALVSHHASEARNGDATPSNSGQSCRYPKKVGFCLSWFVIGGKVNKLPLFFFEKAGGNNHTVLLGFLGLLLAIVVAWGSSYCWLHETLDDSWIRLPLSFYICK